MPSDPLTEGGESQFGVEGPTRSAEQVKLRCDSPARRRGPNQRKTVVTNRFSPLRKVNSEAERHGLRND